jgi:hypothetical protein
VIEQTGEWIRNADTKTGLLATAISVLIAATAGNMHRKQFTAWHSVSGVVSICAGGIFLGCAILAVVHMLAVVIPRTKVAGSISRFSWPWLAAHTEAEINSQVRRIGARREAWAQAKALADIARAKHHHFKRAVAWSVASSGCFLAWLVSISIS